MRCQWTLARCPRVHQCRWWWPHPQPVTIVRTPHLPPTHQTVGAQNRLPDTWRVVASYSLPRPGRWAKAHARPRTHAAAPTHQHRHLHAGTTHARTQPDTRRGNLQPALAVTPCRGTTHPRTHTAAPTHQRRLLHPRTRGSGGPMPSRVAVGPALQRCDRGGLPWAARGSSLRSDQIRSIIQAGSGNGP